MGKRHQDPDLLEELYWGEGLNMDEIADRLGVGYGAVEHQMRHHEIPRRRGYPTGVWEGLSLDDGVFEYEGYLTPTQRDDLRALVGGKSPQERAEERGVDPNTVRVNANNAVERLREVRDSDAPPDRRTGEE